MVIKSLLILGAGNPGALETFYSNGLKKCGVAVETYMIADKYYAAINKSLFNKILNKVSADFFYRSINDELIAFIEKKKFDVILVFKGMELFPETITILKEHTLVIANYNADHPFTYFFPGSGNKNVLNSIPHFDVHFSYSHKIVRELKTRFGKKAFCIPFGYDSNSSIPLPGRGDAYASRFLFIGAFDHERATYLDELHSSLLDIYGDAKWKTRNILRPFIRKAYMNKALYGSEYMQAISSSMGIVNLLRKQNILEDSHNMRTFEVPGFGGLLVSQRTSEQLEYFEEDREAVFFENVEELRDKLEYLSKNRNVVTAIKQAAYKRSVHANYSYDNRSKQLLKCLQDEF